MKDPKRAFYWIVGILEKSKTPFVVVGGLAAYSYGAKRDLNDIDIDVPNSALKLIASLVAPCVTFGPERYRDENFDIELLTLNYEGQEIDLTGADDTRLFDKNSRNWEIVPTDLNAFENIEIFGLIVPVIKKSALISYKKIIGREVDLDDIRQIVR